MVTPQIVWCDINSQRQRRHANRSGLRYSLQANKLNAGMLIRATLIFIPPCCTTLLVFSHCIGTARYGHCGASKTAIAGYL